MFFYSPGRSGSNAFHNRRNGFTTQRPKRLSLCLRSEHPQVFLSPHAALISRHRLGVSLNTGIRASACATHSPILGYHGSGAVAIDRLPFRFLGGIRRGGFIRGNHFEPGRGR